ncbi:MAG TPA: MdtA/MuxA family multidrug efflux RND transporter periplasmic adaptor subunit [Candidatus Acidoferrales bacterium]|nr:MdtA/MuxA family multidrug efflux RND transporter periplasmic adaptor subunit [Candidatus Acidoferrales bacterium]
MSERTVPSMENRVPTETPSANGNGRGRVWGWVLLLLVVVGGVIAYQLHARSQAASKDNGSTSALSVGVSTVEKKDVPYYLSGLGSVTAFNTVTVHTRVDGQLMDVNFKEGQFVRAGDVLATIDSRPYQVALDQAQGQLSKDLASQADAKVDLGRYQQLWQEGVVPRQQLDTQQATVGQFDGAIQSDKAQIDNEKLQLTYCKITSPIDGRVGLRLVDPGNIVHAADTNGMLVITQVQPISVIFTLPEDNIPDVISVMKKRQMTVEAYGRDNKQLLATGKLLTPDNQIDPTTGTLRFKSEFTNQDSSLWPNQFVNIRLFLDVRQKAILVNSAAIQKGAQGAFVYVVDANSQAQVRQVQVDFTEGNSTIVSKGLSAGEIVVVDGAEKLQAGSPVEPHQANPNRSFSNNPTGLAP